MPTKDKETKSKASTQKSPVSEGKKKTANQGKRRILLQFTAEPGSEIFVAGDFNGWDMSQHRLTDKGHPGQFRRHIFVDPGRYEYKFNVNGEWQIDPNCSSWTPNNYGSLNSIITTS